MDKQVSTTKIALALATVYVIWGSTYLAILFAIETLPPFGMAGARFLISGAMLECRSSLRWAKVCISLSDCGAICGRPKPVPFERPARPSELTD